MSAFLKPLERLLKKGVAILLRRLPLSPLPPNADLKSSRRILIIRQHNQLGDMLCIVPLLRSVRSAFPDATIALLASPANLDVMLHNRFVDHVIAFDKRDFLSKWGVRPGNTLTFIRGLRSHKFDAAIVPSTVSVSFTSDLLAYASGARFRIGARSLEGRENPSASLFNLPRDLDWRQDPHRHQTLRNYDIVSGLLSEPGDLLHEMTLLPDELKWGKSFVAAEKRGRRPIIVFHPGAGKSRNRWPAERFADVANRLAREYGSMTLITSGPMDDEATQVMERGLDASYKILKNQYIRSVASVLRYVDLLITNDTGIMHVGGAVGTPVLSLFGPTDPQQWAPLGTGNRYILGRSGDIRSITVEDVLHLAREMLPQKKN